MEDRAVIIIDDARYIHMKYGGERYCEYKDLIPLLTSTCDRYVTCVDDAFIAVPRSCREFVDSYCCEFARREQISMNIIMGARELYNLEGLIDDDKELKEIKESIASGKKPIIWGASPLCKLIAAGLNTPLTSFTIWDTYKANASELDDGFESVEIVKPELTNPTADLTRNNYVILAFSTLKNYDECTKELFAAGYEHVINGTKLLRQILLATIVQ